MNLSSLKSSVFWVVIYAKNSKKIAKHLTLGLGFIVKNCGKIRKYLEAISYFLLIF